MAVGSVGAASYFAHGAGSGKPSQKAEAPTQTAPPAKEGFIDRLRESRLGDTQAKLRQAIAEQLREKLEKGELTPEEEEKLRKAIAGEVARQFRSVLDDEVRAQGVAEGQTPPPMLFDVKV
ncbi:hypothetical protein [Phenylobacterium deserti]|uniref:Uncharacterized protein n=1 Tax=Phenylobacterium deserti TaxID=1914756 RepID=A0A328API8_9CAUL|nr:hypothetical protein [Phenylobacterium deserti]RAK56507.1 hypothetical protein DJ018_00540 [Phenylobacterium deserti]